MCWVIMVQKWNYKSKFIFILCHYLFGVLKCWAQESLLEQVDIFYFFSLGILQINHDILSFLSLRFYLLHCQIIKKLKIAVTFWLYFKNVLFYKGKTQSNESLTFREFPKLFCPLGKILKQVFKIGLDYMLLEQRIFIRNLLECWDNGRV